MFDSLTVTYLLEYIVYCLLLGVLCPLPRYQVPMSGYGVDVVDIFLICV